MALTNEQVRGIENFIEYLRDHAVEGSHDVEIKAYEDYSGRGMYGAKVGGLVIETDSEILKVGFLLGADLPALEEFIADEGGEMFEIDDLPTRSDSLGYDTILY
jgi:hypothetical protein